MIQLDDMHAEHGAHLLKETWLKWRADNSAGFAAALAYYALFAAVPLLILLVAFLSSLLGQGAGEYELSRQIADIFGKESAGFIMELVRGTRHSPNFLAGSISVALTLMGALGVFRQLKWSLDKMWHAPPRVPKNFWARILPDLGIFGMVLIIGALLVLSSIISTVITVLASGVDGKHLPIGLGLIASDTALFFLMSWLLFTAIYYVLPNLRFRFRDIALGSMVTALLFTLGRVFIGLYLQIKDVGSIYGAASAVIALLLWVYISALIFYFGAAFTYVYANRRRILAARNL